MYHTISLRVKFGSSKHEAHMPINMLLFSRGCLYKYLVIYGFLVILLLRILHVLMSFRVFYYWAHGMHIQI